MYVEQEMYSTDGALLEIILMPKNTSEDDFIWNSGLGSFIIGLSNSQNASFFIILTIEFGISIVQILNVTTINLEHVAK